MAGSTPGGPASTMGESKASGGGTGSHRDRAVWFSPDPPPEAVAELAKRFPTVVSFPDEELNAELTSWAASGVVAKSFGRRFQPEALVREFRWRGRFKGDIKAFGLDRGHYLVKFALPEEREKVLGVPWVVNGQTVAVEPWRPAFVPVEGAISHATIWVRLPLLPAEFWGEAAIRRIVSEAGVFVGLDECTAARNRLGFARVCVKVDMGKPLRPGTLIMAGGMPLWQRFVYENLDDLCLQCGVLHPGGSQCPASAGVVGEESGSDSGSTGEGPRLGPWILAVRRRHSAVGGGEGGSGKNGGPARPPGSSPGGEWMKPSRVARREPPVHRPQEQSDGERRRAGGKKVAVGVGVGNPFAVLAQGGERGSVGGGSLQSTSMSKRARPNDFKGSHTSVMLPPSSKLGPGRGKATSRKPRPNQSKGKEVAPGQVQSPPESGRGAEVSGVFTFTASDGGGSGVLEDCHTPSPGGSPSSVAQVVDPMLGSVQQVPGSPVRGLLLMGGPVAVGGDPDASRGSPVPGHDEAVYRLRLAIQGAGEGHPDGRVAVDVGVEEDIMAGVEDAAQAPHSGSS